MFFIQSREALKAIKIEVGSLLFSAQYQQQPVPIEGNLIRRSWFQFYVDLPAGARPQIVQSWDVAMMTGERNDFSVCSTWLVNKDDAYLVDVFRDRLEYPQLRRMVISLAARHKAETILVEEAGPGINLLQDLRASLPAGMNSPIGVKPEGSKVDRMATQAAKIEAGHIFLPRDAPWLGAFLTEILAFPHGRHDDQVDSVSQFLRWLQNSYRNHIKFFPPIVISQPRNFPP